MTAEPSRCRSCKAPAVIDLPRHNANFCADHLMQLCTRQMIKAIVDWDMAEAWDAAGEWFKLELFLFDQLPQTRAAFESAYDAAAPTVDAERRRLVLLMESLNVVANADLNSREFTTWAVDQLKRLS